MKAWTVYTFFMKSTATWLVDLTWMAWCHFMNNPESNVHGANMGPTWVLSAPDGHHVGPMNLAIRFKFSCVRHNNHWTGNLIPHFSDRPPCHWYRDMVYRCLLHIHKYIIYQMETKHCLVPSPGHMQPWYWRCEINCSLSPKRRILAACTISMTRYQMKCKCSSKQFTMVINVSGYGPTSGTSQLIY